MRLFKFGFLIVIVASLLLGCQEDKEEIISLPLDEVFSEESTLSIKIGQVTQRDGSSDNILDQASCLQVVLPVTITVNDSTIIIEDEAGFLDLEKILDDNPADDDRITFSFPITITQPDHSEITVNNEDQFENLREGCEVDDDDIECIDFKFPITLSVFIEQKGTSEEVLITNDKQLHEVVKDLDNEDKVAISFPITIILPDGTEAAVSGNQSLEDLIDQFKDGCEEDDDNDFNDDDADTSGIFTTLKSGQWVVSNFFDKGDETGQFAGYQFFFFEGDSARASTGTTSTEGIWQVNGDDGVLKLDLDFGLEPPLDELEDDWEIISFSDSTINLQNVSGGDGSIETLVFSRFSTPVIDTLSNLLLSSTWAIDHFNDKGEVKTSLFAGYTFSFSIPDILSAANVTQNVPGTWVIGTDNGDQVLLLDFNGIAPLDELEEDWTITVISTTSVELTNTSGSGEQSVLRIIKN